MPQRLVGQVDLLDSESHLSLLVIADHGRRAANSTVVIVKIGQVTNVLINGVACETSLRRRSR